MRKKSFLPNQKLIDRLYDSYYAKNEDSNNRYISSYWRSRGSELKVQRDAKGNITSLQATGLGEIKINNPFNKLLAYICHLSYLVKLSIRTYVLKLMIPSIRVCKAMGTFFSYDFFKQTCALALIIKNMDKVTEKKRPVFLVIGDGCGFLSSLIKSVFPDSTIVLVDIGKTLLFQAYYCQKAHPDRSHHGIDEIHNTNRALENIDFLYCPCELLESLDMFKYDIAINIASMQEMDYPTIERYFSFLRKNCNPKNLFYCSNRESKILPGGEAIEFKKYPWSDNDRHLADEYCPWTKYVLSFGSNENGPKIFGIRIPFIYYMAGAVIHRLTILSP